MFFQYRLNCGCRNKNAFPLRKQLRKMSKIGIKVLFLIKRDDTFSDILRESCGWFAPLLPWTKKAFPCSLYPFIIRLICRLETDSFRAALSLFPLVSTSFLIISYFSCSFIRSLISLIVLNLLRYKLWGYYNTIWGHFHLWLLRTLSYLVYIYPLFLRIHIVRLEIRW